MKLAGVREKMWEIELTGGLRLARVIDSKLLEKMAKKNKLFHFLHLSYRNY